VCALPTALSKYLYGFRRLAVIVGISLPLQIFVPYPAYVRF
jgi:hypothetical protein